MFYLTNRVPKDLFGSLYLVRVTLNGEQYVAHHFRANQVSTRFQLYACAQSDKHL